jgi:hypothetical protein
MRAKSGPLTFVAALFFSMFGYTSTTIGQSLGKFEISYGYNYARGSRKNPSFSDKQSAPGKFKLQLTSRLSVRVQASTIKSKKKEGQARNTGTGDTTFGANFVIVVEDPKKKWPGITVDYSSKVPTASSGLGTGEVDHQFLGMFSRSFTKRLSGEIDGGVYVTGVSKGPNTKSGLVSLIGATGLGHPPNNDFKWTLLEEVDYTTAVTGSPTDISSTTLILRKLNNRWSLTSGIIAGITPYSPKFGFTFGLKYKGSFRRQRF